MSELALDNTNGEMLVHIPMTLTKRQGRKQIILPTGSEIAYARHDITADPVALAIAKGFRWQALLDNGTFLTVRALAKAVKMDTAYVARTIRLTLLAPNIIEAVMAGQCPANLTLERLSKGFPVIWEEQRHLFNMPPAPSASI
ncbi:MAG: hypothetical protein WCJ56_14870 [bacterium]